MYVVGNACTNSNADINVNSHTDTDTDTDTNTNTNTNTAIDTDTNTNTNTNTNTDASPAALGGRYMVVDCGGGTVDITVHEISNEVTVAPLKLPLL